MKIKKIQKIQNLELNPLRQIVGESKRYLCRRDHAVPSLANRPALLTSSESMQLSLLLLLLLLMPVFKFFLVPLAPAPSAPGQLAPASRPTVAPGAVGIRGTPAFNSLRAAWSRFNRAQSASYIASLEAQSERRRALVALMQRLPAPTPTPTSQPRDIPAHKRMMVAFSNLKKCLAADGDSLLLAACDQSNQGAVFEYDPVSGQLHTTSQQCLERRHRQLTLQPCETSSAQLFSWNSAHQTLQHAASSSCLIAQPLSMGACEAATRIDWFAVRSM